MKRILQIPCYNDVETLQPAGWIDQTLPFKGAVLFRYLFMQSGPMGALQNR